MLLMLKAAMLAGGRAMTDYEKIDPFKRDNKAKYSPIDLLRQTVLSADNADSCDNRPCHRNRNEFHALAWLGTTDSVIDLNAFLPAGFTDAVRCTADGVVDRRWHGIV